MKKFFAFGLGLVLCATLCGCQQIQNQAQTLRKNGEGFLQDASKQVEQTKQQVLDTKAKLDEKVREIQDASQKVKAATDAVNKIGQ